MKLVKLVLARPAATGRMSALTAAMEKRMRRVVWRMVPEAAQAAACNPLNAVPRSQPAGYTPWRRGRRRDIQSTPCFVLVNIVATLCIVPQVGTQPSVIK
jgi:hypothetical protein